MHKGSLLRRGPKRLLNVSSERILSSRLYHPHIYAHIRSTTDPHTPIHATSHTHPHPHTCGALAAGGGALWAIHSGLAGTTAKAVLQATGGPKQARGARQWRYGALWAISTGGTQL